jgi:hypothetical protein
MMLERQYAKILVARGFERVDALGQCEEVRIPKGPGHLIE